MSLFVTETRRLLALSLPMVLSQLGVMLWVALRGPAACVTARRQRTEGSHENQNSAAGPSSRICTP